VSVATAAQREAATPPPAYSPHAIHLVRTAVQANIMLSQMADTKASILMGATFVVFTIAVGQGRAGELSPSLLVLAFFAFLSAVCAVMAVLPAIGRPKRGSGKPNVLFFGVFSQFDEDEFADRILPELTADERIFRTMLRDIHQNGMVLQRKKYRYLGYSYRLFLAGLTLTFVVFVAEQLGLIPS
jgi:hypothetical protein